MSQLELIIIVAMGANGVIGKNGKIPWFLPEDLAMFKKVTINKPVLMGRKTFSSILDHLGKPLPGRTSVVLTRNTQMQNEISKKYPNVKLFDCFESAKDWVLKNGHKKMFVAGGEIIYEEMLPFCNEMLITELKESFDGDTYFPRYNTNDWIIKEKGEWLTSKVNNLEYRYCWYTKKLRFK